MELKIGECKVASTQIIDRKFSCKWHPLWESWSEFQQDDDVRKLMTEAVAKMAKASSGGKGLGKRADGKF
eukprot:7108942-Karenia_brevis.AAC.1